MPRLTRSGPIALEEESNGQVFLGGNMNQDSAYPESVADRIDDEVCKIVNYCEQKALQIILDNRVIIDLEPRYTPFMLFGISFIYHQQTQQQ